MDSPLVVKEFNAIEPLEGLATLTGFAGDSKKKVLIRFFAIAVMILYTAFVAAAVALVIHEIPDALSIALLIVTVLAVMGSSILAYVYGVVVYSTRRIKVLQANTTTSDPECCKTLKRKCRNNYVVVCAVAGMIGVFASVQIIQTMFGPPSSSAYASIVRDQKIVPPAVLIVLFISVVLIIAPSLSCVHLIFLNTIDAQTAMVDSLCSKVHSNSPAAIWDGILETKQRFSAIAPLVSPVVIGAAASVALAGLASIIYALRNHDVASGIIAAVALLLTLLLFLAIAKVNEKLTNIAAAIASAEDWPQNDRMDLLTRLSAIQGSTDHRIGISILGLNLSADLLRRLIFAVVGTMFGVALQSLPSAHS